MLKKTLKPKPVEQVSLMETVADYKFDEDGIRKKSVYFTSRHNFKPRKEIPLPKREQSFYQQMRGCDVHYTATSPNSMIALYCTEMTGLRERSKKADKDVTKLPKTPKTPVFREIKVDP
jgi:hypothetical protein